VSTSTGAPQRVIGRQGAPRRRVMVVGSGTRFLSGISYYTHRLALALRERDDVSVVLMRQLLPTRVYPGRERVGKPLARFSYPPDVPIFDGVDWFWGFGIIRALRFLRREDPEVLLLEWWTGTVIHTYLALALLARVRGAKVVIEFHEVLDTGELNLVVARAYVRALAPLLLRLADGFVAHSEFDREALMGRYGLRGPVVVAPHGPYDPPEPSSGPACDAKSTTDGACELLYFGVIRPFKGVEDIVAAFEQLSDEDATRFRLTVIGETWEGWTKPAEAIARSPRRDRIEFVNRYVSDEEAEAAFARADVVVLPYHRSSASGPLHMAMGRGLPVVVSRVGGLVEAAGDYEGTVFCEPRDPATLAGAILQAAELGGRQFTDPHSWERTSHRVSQLIERLAQDRIRA